MPNSSEQTPDEPLRMLPRGARTRRAVAILAALAISAGAVACGSGDDDNGGGSGGSDTSAQEPLSKDAYLKQVNAAQTEFAADASKLHLANPSSAKDFANSLGSLEGLIDTLRQQLAQITPPEDVATEHDDLVRQLGDYRNAIADQKGALASGNPEKAKVAAQKVGKASTEFSQEFDATIKQVNENLGLETGSGQ